MVRPECAFGQVCPVRNSNRRIGLLDIISNELFVFKDFGSEEQRIKQLVSKLRFNL